MDLCVQIRCCGFFFFFFFCQSGLRLCRPGKNVEVIMNGSFGYRSIDERFGFLGGQTAWQNPQVHICLIIVLHKRSLFPSCSCDPLSNSLFSCLINRLSCLNCNFKYPSQIYTLFQKNLWTIWCYNLTKIKTNFSINYIFI